MDEDERKRRAIYEQQQFMKRMRESDPQRATLYCDHAYYIGYMGIFANKCDQCKEQS